MDIHKVSDLPERLTVVELGHRAPSGRRSLDLIGPAASHGDRPLARVVRLAARLLDRRLLDVDQCDAW